jgi:hypothetical protein
LKKIIRTSVVLLKNGAGLMKKYDKRNKF